MDLTAIAAKTKYPVEAFVFVQRGLDYTVRKLHGAEAAEELAEADADAEVEADNLEDDAEGRHVSGQQLCWGLRDFAIEQYGLLAQTVLRRWRIASCADFGAIVFAMVEAELMRKTDDDDPTDFAGVYDFCDAFAPKLTLSDNV